MNIKKAILLVGGKGTRLMPLTARTPKPMLKIAGVPVTEHQIVKARSAGITEIVLATSYFAEVFEPYFGDGSRFGISIKYAVETEPLGTGGAIANAALRLNLAADESVMIFNGDVLSGHNLIAQSELHESKEAEVTLHLVRVEDARAYGCVPITEDGRVLEFLEKMENPKTNTINAGCYIFNSRALNQIPVGEVSSVERDIFPRLLQARRPIFGYEESSYWVDMGTPEAMIRASRELILQPSISPATPQVTGDSLLESDVEISSGAHVGSGSYLQSGVKIDPRSQVIGSIIGENSHIESDVAIENSYIAPETRVKSGSKIMGEIFGFPTN